MSCMALSRVEAFSKLGKDILGKKIEHEKNKMAQGNNGIAKLAHSLKNPNRPVDNYTGRLTKWNYW